MQDGFRTCKERVLYTDREKNRTFWYTNMPYNTIYVVLQRSITFSTLTLYNRLIKSNCSYSEATHDDSTILSFFDLFLSTYFRRR